MKVYIAGGLYGVLLGICGIHYYDWKFWVLMFGACILGLVWKMEAKYE